MHYFETSAVILLNDCRWRAFMILKQIPEAKRPALKLKIFAADALKGCRSNWGSGNDWKGNYLAIVSSADDIILKLTTVAVTVEFIYMYFCKTRLIWCCTIMSLLTLLDYASTLHIMYTETHGTGKRAFCWMDQELLTHSWIFYDI